MSIEYYSYGSSTRYRSRSGVCTLEMSCRAEVAMHHDAQYSLGGAVSFLLVSMCSCEEARAMVASNATCGVVVLLVSRTST